MPSRPPGCDNRRMWEKVVAELRRAGPKKIAVIAILAAIAVVFAYGNNSTNDAANGRTLPASLLRAAHPQLPAAKPQR